MFASRNRGILLWGILGVFLGIFIFYHREWSWLAAIYSAGNLIVFFANPIRRAEAKKPIGMSTVFAGLSVPAVMLSYAACHVLENPLLAIAGILGVLGLIAFFIHAGMKTGANSEISKHL